MIENVAEKAMDYVTAFAGALVLTLLLVPPVRALNRRLGMVDMPDARRINKVPVPRGGGLALFLGVMVSYSAFVVLTGRPPLQGEALVPGLYWRIVAISSWVVALGYADCEQPVPKPRKADYVVRV